MILEECVDLKPSMSGHLRAYSGVIVFTATQ